MGHRALRDGDWSLDQNLHSELRDERQASGPKGEEVLGTKKGTGPKRSA